ncbi:MAG: hypothetical protein UX29_C0009G0017 [Parcubacteria group bacterium GW2011_GWA2_46_10]|nr:MAG: hypothetical protein UX29_C0009G0017 [Parcubacteria group bacterium GW2011_GWA2_46_10]
MSSSTREVLLERVVVSREDMKPLMNRYDGAVPNSRGQMIMAAGARAVQEAKPGGIIPKLCGPVIPTVTARVCFELEGVLPTVMGERIEQVAVIVRHGASREALRDTENVSVITRTPSGSRRFYITEGPIERTCSSIAGLVHQARRWAERAGFFAADDVEDVEPSEEEVTEFEAVLATMASEYGSG